MSLAQQRWMRWSVSPSRRLAAMSRNRACNRRELIVSCEAPSRCDGIGRRDGLKIRWANHPCGFDPRHRHHVVADFVSFATAFPFSKQTLSLIHSVAPPFKMRLAALDSHFAFLEGVGVSTDCTTKDRPVGGGPLWFRRRVSSGSPPQELGRPSAKRD